MYKNFRIIILYFIFFGILNAIDTDIDRHIRDNGTVDLTEGTKVTNMPYGYFIGEFGKSSIKGYDNIDLSSYENKKLLIGYGTYDIKDENCRYLDVPSNSTFDVDFEKRFVFDNATYGISRNKMSYSQCSAKVAQYSGFIYTPKSISELGTTARNFGINKDKWIGYSKSSCSEPYLNNENYEQSYENFAYPVEVCQDNKRFTYSPEDTTTWLRTDQTDNHYCVIKINSPDYLRPIKFCMPWWRVERTWKLDANEDIFEYNGEKYDFRYMQYIIDYPKEKVICTSVDLNKTINGVFKSTIRAKRLKSKVTTSSEDPYEFYNQDVACSTNAIVSNNDMETIFQATCVASTPTTTYSYFDNDVSCTNTDINDGVSTANCKQNKKSYILTCNNYDSIKASPVCIDDISQEVCHVDECSGYIKNTCQKTDTYSPFKDYDVGYILLDNVETKVKVKQNKEINTYKCPQASKSLDTCLAKEEVLVFPAHCPGSKCDELSVCLQDKTKTSEECFTDYPCEKNYGTTDNIIRNTNGVATALGGVCSDNSLIEATIKFKNRETKTCLAYDQFIQTKEEYKTCVSTSQSSNKIVSTSITTNDEYSLDDRCIRTNNIEDARPNVPTVFEYETKGFFKTTIQKAYLDGSEENNEANATTEYILNVINKDMETVNRSFDENSSQLDSEFQINKDFCDNTFSTQWIEQRYQLGNDSYDIRNIIGYLQQTNAGALEKCRSTGTLNNNRCEYNIPACTGTNTYNAITDECTDTNGDPVAFQCSDYDFRIGNVCYEDKWYNYPIVAVSSDKNTCDAYTTRLNFNQNTQGHVFFNDYDFASIGVSQSDINNKNYCIIGGNLLAKNDSIFKSIKISNTNKLYTSANDINKPTCDAYSKCMPSGVITTYTNNTELKQCVIDASDSYGNNPNENLTTISDYNSTVINNTTDITGTFVGEINGYSDVFAIQEYTEGNFGYISNYKFRLPKNNKVLIDSREVSPIIDQSPIVYSLKYDYDMLDRRQKTRNRDPQGADAEASGFFEKSALIAGNGGAGEIIDTIGQLSEAPVALIFGVRQKWGNFNSYHNLYEIKGSKFSINPYTNSNGVSYDPRVQELTKLIWDKRTLKTGVLKKADFLGLLTHIIGSKKDNFLNMGFTEDMVNDYLTSTTEHSASSYGFPDAPKYWWGTEKLYYSESKTNSSSHTGLDVNKNINTIYMGAVNSLSIVVPYKGEYEIKAYDSNNNLLGTKIVQEQNFISNTTSTSGSIAQTYAKVQMATADNFNIAPGQNRNLTDGGCLSSNFVEWGGGVSGAYYEKGVPDIGLGSNCYKSNDVYVQSHSARKITLRATNSDNIFNIDLKRPMPYPNRIVLVNLMQLENRKYECWTDIEKCTITNDSNTTE